MKVKVYPRSAPARCACRHPSRWRTGRCSVQGWRRERRASPVSPPPRTWPRPAAHEALGAKVVRSGDCCTVSGCGGALFDLPETAIDCRESARRCGF